MHFAISGFNYVNESHALYSVFTWRRPFFLVKRCVRMRMGMRRHELFVLCALCDLLCFGHGQVCWGQVLLRLMLFPVGVVVLNIRSLSGDRRPLFHP